MNKFKEGDLIVQEGIKPWEREVLKVTSIGKTGKNARAYDSIKNIYIEVSLRKMRLANEKEITTHVVKKVST